jgi:hypothetical protein
MTNPPFGGEEERGILGNFPEDKQTSETALLFLQLIMRKLKRPPKPGRAAVVVPNGTLFGDGVSRGSRKNCSRTSTFTRSSDCRTLSSRRTRASRPICSSSTALIRQKKFGATSSRCPKAEKTTPRPNRYSSKNSPAALSGARVAKKTSAPGRSPPQSWWNTIQTDH